MKHALSFDVEDYFHVHAYRGLIDRAHWDEYPQRVSVGTRIILDILASANVKATFFVLGWVARREPELVRAIVAAGHELASHGTYHERVDELTPMQFRQDVRSAKRVLEQISGRRVTAYRAPSFSITAATPWAHRILAEEGYEIDSSLSTGRGERSLTSGGRPFLIETGAGHLRELPMPRMHLLGRTVPVGGGGYFRLFPEWLTHRALRKLDAKGRPFCVYLHPWEFDVDQPRLNCSPVTTFRHHVNIARCAERLTRLLQAFEFGTVGEVMDQHVTMRRHDRQAA